MLGIKILNVCNYKCYFCESQFVTDHKIMSNTEYFKIIDSAVKIGINEFELTPLDGEVFVDSHFIEKLEYTLTYGSVSFITNFSLCTPAIQDKLKELQKLYKLSIFISDYGDNDVNYYMFQTQQTEKVWNKLQQNLIYAKKINLIINMLYRGKDYPFQFNNITKQMKDVYKTAEVNDIHRSGVCYRQFMPSVYINGNVSACACEVDTDKSELYLGNINETPFEDLFFSKKRYNLFKDHSNGIYNKTCQDCNMFNNSRKADSTFIKMLNTIRKNKC